MKYLLVIALILANGTAAAAGAPRQGFWGDIDVGYGRLDLRPAAVDHNSATRFYLGVTGGYTLHPQLQLGVELSSWIVRWNSLWDSSQGEGLAQLFAVARIWPTADSKLFFKVGGGSISHWNNTKGAGSGGGSGYCVGLGYRVAQYGGTETDWFLNYNTGHVSGYRPPGGVRLGEDYSAITAGLSLGF